MRIDNFKISDIYLGVNDGKKEAFKVDFEKYFVDYNNMYEEILQPDKYIILGRKGSGKTILAQYVKKRAKEESTWFCEVKSFKDFRFHELMNLKTDDVAPNEYSAIWRWIVLIDLGKLILKDNGIKDKETKLRLEKFFKENYYSINIDNKKVLEITKTNKIKGSILKAVFEIGGEFETQKKYEESSYLNYLEDLEDVVMTLLQSSGSKYTLFYDELDDRFQKNDFYKNSIISLIKAVDSLNCLMLENSVDAKVVLLIRSDIFSILNDTDLNKIKLVNAFEINWGDKISSASPLINLVFQNQFRP